jgi:uncharacterized Zn-finger protein
MEEISTQVSPAMYTNKDSIELNEEYESLDLGETSNIESKCSICGKILSSKKNMKKHFKLHSDDRNYSCKLCNKSYKRSDHLKRHMIIHDPEPNYFECDYCLKRFNLKYHLTAHLQNVHGKATLKIYKCPDCDECFHKKSKLFLHQKDIHNLVVDKIPCYYPYCNKSYISEQKLNYHIQHTHLNLLNNSKEGIFLNKKRNDNNDNIFSFNNINESNKDLDSENSNNEKKYFKCPYKECLKVYSSHYNLSVHIKTFHLKIKSFVCYLCGNKYYHKVSLKNHLMIEHKLNQKELLQNLNSKVELKDEVINEAKKNLEKEGLLKEDNSDKERNKSENNSRKISEDGSNESKNNELFLKEFHNNIINDFSFMEHQIES